MDRLIEDTAERIFADHVDKTLLDRAEASAGGAFPQALWDTIMETGLHLVGRPDSGTTMDDLFGLLKVAGRHAVPLPLAEVLLANAVLADHPVSDGFTTIAVDGVAPWARAAERVVDPSGDLYLEFTVEPAENIAGEPRDRVVPRRTTPVPLPDDLYELLALSRTALMAGALDRVLAMTIGYATERQQFGRPISKFQAVQHNLAVLAGEVAAAGRACDGAIESLGAAGFVNQVAAAKARVGEAAGVVAEIAHQVHGAFGFTYEHSLHHFTRRLWAWRDECGRESEWHERLGRYVAQRRRRQRLGFHHPWPLTSRVRHPHPSQRWR